MTPLHFCHEIPRFPKYEYILPNGHCVLTQQVYQLTDGIISKLRCYCAQKHHLHSLIHTISALANTHKLHNKFFLGTLYLYNGGWNLTVVRALINFRHLTNRHENYAKSKKNISINNRRMSTSQHYTLIDMSPRHAPICEGKNFRWAELRHAL